MLIATLATAIALLPGAPSTIIRCAPIPTAYLGETIFKDGSAIRVKLSPNSCADLRAPRRSIRFARGLFVLTHEAGHVVMGRSERCAEAYARAFWPRLGRTLGLRHPTTAQRRYLVWFDSAQPTNYQGTCP